MNRISYVKLLFSLITATIFISGCQQLKTSTRPSSNSGSQGGGAGAPPVKCGSSVVLSWTPPTTNVDGTPCIDLAGFNIYYSTDTTTLNNEQNIPGAAVTTYTLFNLAPGTYYFAATAYNTSAQESDKTNQVAITLAACQTVNLNLFGRPAGQ